MHLWQRASNYFGEDYSDYYVVLSQHRDSPLADKVNFEVALKELGGESETVIIARSSHWAVGWVEALLVHKSDTERVAQGNDIEAHLSSYPLLDESLYCAREWNAMVEYWRSLPAWVRKRDYHATARQARMSLSKLARIGADNVVEAIQQSVSE